MLTVVLAILLVLLALLAIPIDFVYRVSWDGQFQGELHVQWLFGLLHVRVPLEKPSSTETTKESPARQTKQKKPKAKRKTNPLAAWRLRSFRQRIWKFVRDLWRAIHKRDLHLQLQIGLDDPADTGRLWAILGPLSAICTQSKSVQIDIAPDFTDSHLEFNSSGNIRIIPLQLLAIIIGLLLSPPFWYGLRQMQTAR
jgi:hypothetical protein